MRYKIVIIIAGILSNYLFAREVPFADFMPVTPQQQYVEGECIVKFKQDVGEDSIFKIGQLFGFQTLKYYQYGKFYRIRIPGKDTTLEFAARLNNYPAIEYAHPDYFMKAQLSSSDSLDRTQWNLGAVEYGGINLNNQRGGTKSVLYNVVIAVIDGGVAFEDYGNFKKAPALVKVPFLSGYDFVNDDNHPNDDAGHGTHLTTLIAGLVSKKEQTTGSSSVLSFLPVKVLDSKGLGRSSDIAEGIHFAINRGATILNMSFGGPDSPVLQDAVQLAFSRGIVLVCAAGNVSSGSNDSIFYPAAYNEFCIAVGAHGVNGLPAPYSLKSDYIDISAPGGTRRLDLNDDGVKDGIVQQTFYKNPSVFNLYLGEGTSYAAAHVTAVAALLKINGVNGADKIRQALELSAYDKKPAGWDRSSGWGLLDASGALAFFPEPKHDIAISDVKIPQWCIKGEQIQVIVTVSNRGIYEENTEIVIYDSLTANTIAQTVQLLKPGETKRNVFVWNTVKEVIGTHLLSISAYAVGDEDPEDNIQINEVTITNDFHDVAIVGVEQKKQKHSGQMQDTVNVQLSNNGTYNELVHISINSVEGLLLGYADITVNAKSYYTIPVVCDLNKITDTDSLRVVVETSDQKETNLKNNSVVVPLRF